MVGSVLKKKFSKNAREGRDFFNVIEMDPRGGERFEKKGLVPGILAAELVEDIYLMKPKPL